MTALFSFAKHCFCQNPEPKLSTFSKLTQCSQYILKSKIIFGILILQEVPNLIYFRFRNSANEARLFKIIILLQDSMRFWPFTVTIRQVIHCPALSKPWQRALKQFSLFLTIHHSWMVMNGHKWSQKTVTIPYIKRKINSNWTYFKGNKRPRSNISPLV